MSAPRDHRPPRQSTAAWHGQPPPVLIPTRCSSARPPRPQALSPPSSPPTITTT